MRKTKLVAILACMIAAALILSGCTQASRVSLNVSKEADNFNVTRRLAVINARTDKPMFELIGTFALENNDAGELTIICQTGPSTYKKHFVYLTDYTMYVVEDISGADVSPFQYEINFLPEMLVPYTVTTSY